MTERWKQIGDSNYHISDCGNVYGYRGMLRFRIVQGRKLVQLGKMSTSASVHRLVARAFIPNPHNYPNVRFKDGDMLNCHWTNLEWEPRRTHNCICATCGEKKPIKAFAVIHTHGPTVYRYRNCSRCRYLKEKQRAYEKLFAA